MEYLQFLPYIVALVVAIPFLMLSRYFISIYIKLKERELALISTKSDGGNKLQAYERMVVFLERMKPSNLVKNYDETLKPYEFVFLTEKAITEELNYNASQQLYYLGKTLFQRRLASCNSLIRHCKIWAKMQVCKISKPYF